jgi:hypothetical protein
VNSQREALTITIPSDLLQLLHPGPHSLWRLPLELDKPRQSAAGQTEAGPVQTITMEPVQTITPTARRRAGPLVATAGRCITSTGVDQTATGVEATTKKEAPALAILSPMRHSSHTPGDSRWQDRIECSSRQLTNHEAG